MNVAELIAHVIAGSGAGQAFGVVGSGNFALTNALRAEGVPFTAARHEMGAATMADAYARMTERLAVVTTHQGCGLSNAVTGIGEAAKSRTPMLVLTADTPGAAVRSNFRIDQDAMVRAVGAVAERVHSAASAEADTVRACRTALEQRRTVVLSVPTDVQAESVPEPGPNTVAAPKTVRPAAESVTALADLLAAADRPVFIAGRGARGSGAGLRALAEESGALLATSAVANGLFTGDPFALGISGGFSGTLTAELIAEADLIVGWGAALNNWTTRHGKLLGTQAKLVHVDVDQAAFGAYFPVALAVLGDVASTCADLRTELGARGHRASGYRTEEIRARIAESGWVGAEPYPEITAPGRIDPRTLSIALDELLPTERIVSIDSGNFMGYPSAYLRVPDEYGFCFTQAFQSIGLGLATAIGSALARPDRIPVAALGDGGFHMAVAELETVVRLGIPMLIVVYNDAAYGAEVHHFSAGSDLETVRFPDTDIAAIARGFGAEGCTVRVREDLDTVRDWLAAGPGGPLVVDAKIAEDGGAWWLAEAFG
ncbi:thiamine pyrophosphate-binding protein [Sciscionella sediminilitoris]|uniref:thiamine pyrophosphate-binding protein n=1 Tax=Sciscionella sediminilitoris TaxID=1445613 RepID=UPI0004DF1A4B|nr:thiamine pyrophosphate-binding protein [Sciscionella sp. SE31]